MADDSCGLDITESQFMKLGPKEQNLILFKNVVFIRKKFKDYNLNKKIQYVWLSALTTAIMIVAGIKSKLGV